MQLYNSHKSFLTACTGASGSTATTCWTILSISGEALTLEKSDSDMIGPVAVLTLSSFDGKACVIPIVNGHYVMVRLVWDTYS